MTDDDLLRYSRHILLAAVGIEGQQRLLDAHAVVVGCGGLGSPVALYLGAAGVGRLTLVDADTVDLTNLQRQIGHDMAGLGRPKADSLRERLAAVNPGVQVQVLRERADAARLDALAADADVLLDCSDNFATRQALNAAAVRHRVPLVSGAALGLDGQVAVYDPRAADSPCYACVFPPASAVTEAACSTLGVLAPLVGVVGSLQATHALRLLAGVGEPAHGRLAMFDAASARWTELRVPRDPGCPVCAARAAG